VASSTSNVGASAAGATLSAAFSEAAGVSITRIIQRARGDVNWIACKCQVRETPCVFVAAAHRVACREHVGSSLLKVSLRAVFAKQSPWNEIALSQKPLLAMTFKAHSLGGPLQFLSRPPSTHTTDTPIHLSRVPTRACPRRRPRAWRRGCGQRG